MLRSSSSLLRVSRSGGVSRLWAASSSTFSTTPNPPSHPAQNEQSGGVESKGGKTRADATASNIQKSSSPSTSTSTPLSSATPSTTGSASLSATATPYPSQQAPPLSSSPSPSSIHLHPVAEPFGLASGAPEQFVHRKVRISRPSSTASQQGFSGLWKLEFDTTTKWLNPLMGWTSSKDTANQLTNSMTFATVEEAVRFAEREGFDWELMKDHEPKVVKKSYADNYKWSHTRALHTPQITHNEPGHLSYNY